MDARSVFVSVSHGALVGLSVFGLSSSYSAITKLRGYEETTKKLAQWSSTVEQELYKTRTTQASGAIATTVSLLASLTLLLVQRRLPNMLAYSISPFMLLAVLLARGHIKNYWTPHKTTTSEGKEKSTGVKVPALPNLEAYREAQKRTEDLLLALEWLEYSWLASCCVSGLVGYE